MCRRAARSWDAQRRGLRLWRHPEWRRCTLRHALWGRDRRWVRSSLSLRRLVHPVRLRDWRYPGSSLLIITLRAGASNAAGLFDAGLIWLEYRMASLNAWKAGRWPGPIAWSGAMKKNICRGLRIACAVVGAWLLILNAAASAQAPAGAAMSGWAIAIHGGAGESEWEQMDAATAAAYRASLAKALAAGSDVLKRKGTALDAVEAAVEVLEDDPLFNAGRGSAFADDGTNEMDAALMDGSSLAAGSVADVHFTRHPIALARAVMEHTPYVMMVGEGADTFARAQGIEQQPASFFFTEMRW